MSGVITILIIVGVGYYLYNKRKQRVKELEYQFEVSATGPTTTVTNDTFKIYVIPTIFTPLNILELRGMTFKKRQKAERLRSKSRYIRIVNLEFRDLDKIWSDVGNFYDEQEAEKYFEFIEQIRMIIEDDSLSVDVKMNDIIHTCKQKTHYREYFQKLNDEYDSFPACLFYKELTKINGIGDSTALDLFNSGFLSLDDLEKASDKELIEVPGVGKKTVKQIRNYFNNRISL